MSDVPAQAIEAAAERLHGMIPVLGPADWHDEARAAVEAAMPAIREAIAQEIETARCTDPACHPVAADIVELIRVGVDPEITLARGGTP